MKNLSQWYLICIAWSMRLHIFLLINHIHFLFCEFSLCYLKKYSSRTFCRTSMNHQIYPVYLCQMGGSYLLLSSYQPETFKFLLGKLKPMLLRGSGLARVNIKLRNVILADWVMNKAFTILIIPPFGSFSILLSLGCALSKLYMKNVAEGTTRWCDSIHSIYFISLGGARVGTL